ncbi:3-deoxy-8-phosphooctulonate synthase [Puniceicoccus vermicola]|uniref:2-dehydro-3-deoxyphosphooctonate aldolase n=1 Tax=Puniceicoccus vermicola TaxID=388746 RepID=A0A7X1E4G3_9BACT|nr:3-deoxy-8-phosphooctulonate synthase [Puniceicoccus vermicola]MBC2602029.1 3-deoxy-8-phosphooctulonate synthase [Puniceicoccus vermicola]
MAETVSLSDSISFSNDGPLVLMAGINVLESEDLAFEVAETMVEVTGRLGVPYVFKASFDKANRSSIHSFRGPGLEKGLEILAAVKAKFGVPVISDVHEPFQAKPAAEVCDILQLPAFLCRQTDLVKSLARAGTVIQVKKGQFLAPDDMRHILTKFAECGNERILLCERGVSFGYHNLVVDMLGFGVMKNLGAPVVFDVTHSLQVPGGRESSSGGRREAALQLAKAGVSQKIAGLFLETHPNPDKALCDGPSALPLSAFEPFLQQVIEVDRLVKGQPDLDLS